MPCSTCNNQYNTCDPCNTCNTAINTDHTPQLIDCAELPTIMETLKSNFETCNVLNASDLDLLVDVIYSVQNCPSTSADPLNNLIVSLDVSPVNDESEISSRINMLPQFTIDESQILFFNITVDGVDSVYALRTGKGSYGVGGETLLTNNDIYLVSKQGGDEYTLSPISGTNELSLLKNGDIISTIDLTPYLDDTNLSRLVSGTVIGNTLTVTRDDSTTFDIDISDLVPQDLIGYRETGSYLTGDFTICIGDFDDEDTGSKITFDVSDAIIGFDGMDVLIKNGSILVLEETNGDRIWLATDNISGPKKIDLPNNEGTLVSTINGNPADINGNVNTSLYKSYFANITQVRTSNPTTTVYEDFDTPVTWVRTAIGKYVSNIPNNSSMIPIVHNSDYKIDGTTTEFYQVSITTGVSGFFEMNHLWYRAGGTAEPLDGFSRLIEIRDYS